MSDEIVFYHNPRSRSQMVHWILEEAGAPHRIMPIDFEKGEHKTASFLALNPMGKLPTIVHRDVVVAETAAIIAYIADMFPAAGLAPSPGDALRGAYYRWLFFGAPGLKGEKAFDDYVARLSARPAAQRTSGG
jgi:glutathione S-transferase